MPKNQYVQFGCGLSAPASWRNFDASPTLLLQRQPWPVSAIVRRHRVRFPDNVEYGDITRGLPLSDSSCDAVYCSHVLEHLSLDDFRRALAETKRILKAGGVFRGVLPDLEFLIQEYVRDGSPEASIRFMRNSLLGKETRSRGILSMAELMWGNQEHLWMWDYNGLASELTNAGFSRVRRAYYGDSEDVAFADVETRDRWENAVGFECASELD